MGDLTDESIAREVQLGKTNDFVVLVERYEKPLLRYAKKFLFGYEDAEDLVQDVFIKAYTNIQGFDPGRSFGAWIYRIAHNTFINAIRKKGKEPLPFFDPDTLFPHPIAQERAEKEAHDNDLHKMLDECLNQLDPKYREPLVLYYYENLSYEEIAQIVRIPLSTVGVRLNRGKVLLKKVYERSKHNQ